MQGSVVAAAVVGGSGAVHGPGSLLNAWNDVWYLLAAWSVLLSARTAFRPQMRLAAL